MLTVTYTFEFESAHRLYKYQGKCSNIHGHNYKVEVGISGKQRNDGIVVDFHDLEKIAKKVTDILDHALILYENDSLLKGKTGTLRNMKVVVTSWNPTAENISKYIFRTFKLNLERGKVEFVRVWETDKASAIYRGGR